MSYFFHALLNNNGNAFAEQLTPLIFPLHNIFISRAMTKQEKAQEGGALVLVNRLHFSVIATAKTMPTMMTAMMRPAARRRKIPPARRKKRKNQKKRRKRLFQPRESHLVLRHIVEI